MEYIYQNENWLIFTWDTNALQLLLGEVRNKQRQGEVSKPRKELWKIPETVFKEAIINSLAHRNYYDKGGRITIRLFDD